MNLPHPIREPSPPRIPFSHLSGTSGSGSHVVGSRTRRRGSRGYENKADTRGGAVEMALAARPLARSDENAVVKCGALRLANGTEPLAEVGG